MAAWCHLYLHFEVSCLEVATPMEQLEAEAAL